MKLIYNTIAFQSYGLTLVFFTIFVRILLFPLNLKQQKSMLRTQELQPEIEELKEMYGHDKEKFNEEQMKLYQKYNINPMAGCFPMLIQLPLILSIYRIVTKPLSYISGVSTSAISALQGFVAKALDISKSGTVSEILINDFFLKNEDKLAEVAEHLTQGQLLNMRFLGIFDLGLTPSLSGKLFSEPLVYLPLLLIPITSAITSYLIQRSTTVASINKSKKNDDKAPDTANPLNTMNKVMPIISLIFTFNVPAGVGLYWIIGNLLGIAQNFVTKKVFDKKKEGNE